VAGAIIIIACIYWIIWAKKNDQFDEDLKYVIFQEDDIDKMSKEDYQKSREVIEQQIARRNEVLAQEKLAKQQKRAT
jgi:cbb3-type cytochrome oxidase subunit 3